MNPFRTKETEGACLPADSTTQQSQWIKVTDKIFESLPPGNYPLRHKLTVTPTVSGTEHCSVDDQIMFGLLDDMARHMLNSVIQQKIRAMNKKKVKVVLSVKNVFDKVQEQTLRVMENKMGIREKKNMGELFAMAYDQIYIPIGEGDASSTTSRNVRPSNPVSAEVSVLDHNYWNTDATTRRSS